MWCWWCPHSDTFNKYFVCYGHLTDYQICTIRNVFTAVFLWIWVLHSRKSIYHLVDSYTSPEIDHNFFFSLKDLSLFCLFCSLDNTHRNFGRNYNNRMRPWPLPLTHFTNACAYIVAEIDFMNLFESLYMDIIWMTYRDLAWRIRFNF